jgi:hypothetical protein
MSVGFEARDDANRIMFNTESVPYVFLGKTTVGANAGVAVTSTARNQDALAPTLVGIETVSVQCPAGTLFAAVTGNKACSAIGIGTNNSTGLRYCAFTGLASGTSTLYFFGPRSGGSSLNFGLETYTSDGVLTFDLGSRFMKIIPGNGQTYLTVPSGKTYAVLNQVFEVASGNVYVGPSSQGNKSYTRFYTGAGYSDASQAGITRINIDIVQFAAGDPNDLVVQRAGIPVFVDVTGL